MEEKAQESSKKSIEATKMTKEEEELSAERLKKQSYDLTPEGKIAAEKE